MPEPPLSPSQQVERIREILVGRQMQLVEERLERLERLMAVSMPAAPEPFPAYAENPAPPAAPPTEDFAAAFAQRDHQIAELARVLAVAGERLNDTSSQLSRHDKLLNEELREVLEGLSTSMAERVDARVREVLDHLQGELDGLREQLQGELAHLADVKADRRELNDRLSRIATAALAQDSSLEPKEGFLP